MWQRCKTTMSMLSRQSHPPAPYKHTHIHGQLFRQVAHITKLLEQLSTLESRRCDNNQHGARSLSQRPYTNQLGHYITVKLEHYLVPSASHAISIVKSVNLSLSLSSLWIYIPLDLLTVSVCV